MVLYESPHRILKLLGEIEDYFTDARVFIAREITKIHEEYLCGTPSEMIERFTDEKIRGEFVVVVSPPGKKAKNQRSKNRNKFDTDSDTCDEP